MKTYTKPVVNFNKAGNTKDVKTLEDIDTKTLFRINPNYLLRQVADDYVIIPIDDELELSNAIMTPNRSAVFIWNEFLDANTIENVIKKALSKYDVSEETIRRDVRRFVFESLNKKIIEEVN